MTSHLSHPKKQTSMRNFSKPNSFSLTKLHLKLSSMIMPPFCFGGVGVKTTHEHIFEPLFSSLCPDILTNCIICKTWNLLTILLSLWHSPSKHQTRASHLCACWCPGTSFVTELMQPHCYLSLWNGICQSLTHWGWVNWSIIGSGNDLSALSHVRGQTIIWTNVRLWLIVRMGI